MSHSYETIARSLTEAKELVKIGALYYHYRSPNLHYMVKDIVVYEENDQPMIIYEALYGDKVTWARQLDKWLDVLDFEGVKVPRFSLVTKE